MPTLDGELLELKPDLWALRFERTLSHPPEKVWRALTERDHMAGWHPSPADIAPRLGAMITYPDEMGFDTGRVLEVDPPRLLVHTWGGDLLRWELVPAGDGTELTLTHEFRDHWKAARDGAGWHTCLDRLHAKLDGAQSDSAWSELNTEYQARFDIDPADATPLPN